MRSRPYHRTTTAALAAATLLATAVFAAPSAAAEERAPARTENGLINELTTLTLAGKLALNPATGKASIVDAKQITQVVDRLGHALTPLRVSATTANASEPAGRYSCYQDGKGKKGFVVFDPASWGYNGEVGVLQYTFYPYMQPEARERLSGLTTQYEICGVGGADLKDGYRIHQTGLGVAFPDTRRVFKIGQAWKTGKTPSDYTLGLGFELGKEPLAINGSISQNPSDKLKGSIVGPYETYLDAYAFNGVNAWWEDGCVNGWTHCKTKFDGSPDFQGTVVHGLWEFEPAQAANVRYFLVNPYLKYGCHGFTCG